MNASLTPTSNMILTDTAQVQFHGFDDEQNSGISLTSIDEKMCIHHRHPRASEILKLFSAALTSGDSKKALFMIDTLDTCAITLTGNSGRANGDQNQKLIDKCIRDDEELKKSLMRLYEKAVKLQWTRKLS